MNMPEPRTDLSPRQTLKSDLDPPPPDPKPTDPLCGTTTTPPCPNKLVYQERDMLLSRLIGPQPTPDKVRVATERVNSYLAGVLHSGLKLVGYSAPETLPLYELRAELIYQVAGVRPSSERVDDSTQHCIDAATEQVDDYLLGELQSGLQVTRFIVDRLFNRGRTCR